MDRFNYSEWRYFKEVVCEAVPDFDVKTLRPMLWKDEINDVFILTKTMEIYLYSRTVLGCYCWRKKTYLQLKKMGVIFDEWDTDDGNIYLQVRYSEFNLDFAIGGHF